MDLLYILLLLQGITGEMVLYQPQNIVSMNVNGTAVITCVSTEDLDSRHKIFWYHRKWRQSEGPVLVKSCSPDNDIHKYVCEKHEKYVASLKIYNIQINDSGVYYCVYLYTNSWKFGNGTILNVGNRSTSRSSIHILGHLQPHLHHNSLQLTCLVLVANNTVHLSWNISGTYHKGWIISKEESDGTWTVMNSITLPKDNWSHRKKVTCEVWAQSSLTSVHWEIPGQDISITICQSFLIPVVTAGILLMLMLSVHLIKTLRLIGNKTPDLMEKNMIEDEITYSELNMNHCTRITNQTAQ